MKTLYLLRHANAVNRITNFSDYDRPLDEIGKMQAQAVAQYIQTKNIGFDFVMCSAAMRAQETLEPMRPVLGTTDLDVSEAFYNLTDEKILAALRTIDDARERVLYIGHNPGLTFAIIKLVKQFPQIVNEGITPATLVGLQLPVDSWSDVDWWQGQLMDVFQPTLPSEEAPSQTES